MGMRHAENIRRLVPEARLIAIADRTFLRQSGRHAGVQGSRCSVLIATPDKFHAQAVEVAARAGKDILGEKPLALTLADASSALRAVAKAGRRLQVGFMRRYDPAYYWGSCPVQIHRA
jgi:myo-inositol 2-dehydrogenase / D-chiro-inositol 1-dehydrogenase